MFCVIKLSEGHRKARSVYVLFCSKEIKVIYYFVLRRIVVTLLPTKQQKDSDNIYAALMTRLGASKINFVQKKKIRKLFE